MNRRNFLKALGLGSGTTALAACGVDDNRYYTPVEQILPYVTGPEQTTPGTNTHFATVVGTGPRAWPVVAVHRDGRVINVGANRLAPVPAAVPAVQLFDLQRHYSPDRIGKPRKGGSEIAWDAALAELSGAVKAAKSSGKEVAWLGGYRSGTIVQLLQGFAERTVFWEPLGLEAEALAARALFGRNAGLPKYDLENAKYILSFGAGFLGDSWGNPGVRAAFAKARDARSGSVARFTLVSPHKDQSGASADEWLQCVPGTEALVAMGIAKALAETKAYQGPARPLIDAVDLDAVGATSGVSKETVQHLASMFGTGGAVALPGGLSGAGAGATDLAAAVYVLNLIADQRDLFSAGGYRGPVSSYRDLLDLIDALEQGKVGVLIVDDADPVYASPDGARFAAAAAKAGLVVSTSSHPSETNATAGLVLPTHDVFEDWGDEEPWAGMHLLRQPGSRPLHDSRSLGDVVLVAWRAATDGAPPGSWRDYLQRRWRRRFFDETETEQDEEATPGIAVGEPTPGAGDPGAPGTGPAEDGPGRDGRRRRRDGGGGPDADPSGAPGIEPAPAPVVRSDADFERWWQEKLQVGFHQGRAPRRLEVRGAMTLAGASTHAGSGQYFLHVFPHQFLLDGRYANEPWAQETPDPMTGHTWDTWVLVHPTTAEALGVGDNDGLRIQTDAGSIEVGVEVHPCVRPDVLAVPMGGGHAATAGRYAEGVGANVVKLLASTVDAAGAFVWQQAKCSATPTGQAKELTSTFGGDEDHGRAFVAVVDAGEWVGAKDEPAEHPGHLTGIHVFEMDQRLLGLEKQWRSENPTAEPEKESYTSFYPVPDHPTYRFALTVDTNACNGCGACAVACAAENNLPVVGKWKLKKRRQMAWIRVDRFFAAHTADGSQSVHFVPLMCQHCGHAPCESVCPVLATYHTIDGLNAMIYNRCVGTRYCANACPYSARRFNYHTYEWPEPFNLQLNPDVTARTMGVMEKCTFCVQRIRATKLAYRAQGFTNTVPNQALEQLTACAEACPSQALTFGNLLDPESTPAKSRKSGRTYQLLRDLNTYPAVNYLARASFNVQRPHHGAGAEQHGSGTSAEHGGEH